MFDIYCPYPEIMIFKKGLKNPQKIIDYVDSCDGWMDWYTFGKMIDFSKSPGRFEKFPTEDQWFNLIPSNDDKEKTECIGMITDNFYYATKTYFEKNNIDISFLSFETFNVAKYLSKGGVSEEYAMNYHTDWQQEKVRFPEYKFHTTCLFYLNDNYEGGEIVFKKLNKSQTEIEYTFEYKPSAGDIVVFPSTPPFYHGVKATTNGEKYLIRTYWKNWVAPNDYWNKGIEQQGTEKWLEFQEKESLELRKKSFMIDEHYFQGNRSILEEKV